MKNTAEQLNYDTSLSQEQLDVLEEVKTVYPEDEARFNRAVYLMTEENVKPENLLEKLKAETTVKSEKPYGIDPKSGVIDFNLKKKATK